MRFNLGIAEFVTLDKLLNVFGLCLPCVVV